MSHKINVIVYSKDRPAQLDLLLQSFIYAYQGDHNTTVIFKASNDAYRKAYEKTIEHNMSDSILFQEETNFRQQTMNAIQLENKYTMFLVDDIMFMNKWSLNDEPFELFRAKEDGILCVSLRLGHNTNYCYPISSEQKIPNFVKKYAWNWTKEFGDFGYPMSLDGNVYTTESIVKILTKLDPHKVTHPNIFESELNSYAQSNKYSEELAQIMVCYEESVLFNNPCNRVQDIIKNKNEESYLPEILCERYKEDRLSFSKMLIAIKNQKVNAAHYPTELIFYDK